MPRTSLFGLPLSWSKNKSFEIDPIARLLEPLDLPIAPSSSSPSEPPGLRISLRPASSAAAKDPLAEGARPSFYQGIIQAYRVEPAGAEPSAPPTFLLWDRASRVRVNLALGCPRIEADIAPEDREMAPGSTLAMLHLALALALRCHGLFHLHAAAVVHPSGAGILIAGSSGAGKTTATLALLESAPSYLYLGDDSLFVRRNPSDPAALDVLAFPRAFHLGPETLSAFPRLRPLAGPPTGARGKLAVDPRAAFPGRSRPTTKPPSIVLFPQIRASAQSSLAPVAPADALLPLITSSAALLIDGAPAQAENLAIIAKLLPRAGAFELALGRDALTAPVASLAPLIERALEAAGPHDVANS